METLELKPTHRTGSWYSALVAGLVAAYLVFQARQRFFPVIDGSLFSPVDLLALVLGALIALTLGSLESSVAIEISEPPSLVTIRTWFGKFTYKKRTPLTNIVWTRVVYADDMLLSVEVGNYGYQTTSVVCVPYSEQNIPVAEQLCAKIAAALEIENKGYHRYV